MMEFKKTVLKNGLRIITAPQKDNPAVTITVLVEVGSKYEDKKISGISHFLEHMCFKGTKKRPTQLAVSSELDRLGASYNALTSLEYTGYYIKVDKGHFDKALDMISDIYLNQIFDVEAIEKEKGVIVEELNMYEDDPPSKAADDFYRLLYGDQPAGRDVLGNRKTIRGFTRDDFVTYRKNHYVADATVIAVAGAINEQEVIVKIERAFATIAVGQKEGKAPVSEEQSEPGLTVREKKTEQTQMILGVRSYNILDDRKYPLEVLADIMGGSMSSHLWQKIRTQMGAAYSVWASTQEFSDSGVLLVRAGLEHAKVEKVIKAVLDEFRLFKEKSVSKKELEDAKDHIIGEMMLGLETSNSLTWHYGLQELLTRKPLRPDEEAAKLRRVTAHDIRAIARDIFVNEGLNLALLGPGFNESRLQRILKID